MHERCEVLTALKLKDLLDIAKGLQVVGRHEMTKKVLVDAIIAAEQKTAQTADDTIVVEESGDLELELAIEAGAEVQWESQVAIDSSAAEKSVYVENATIGQLIAFKVNEKKALSGKIVEIHQTLFMVETKNKVKFTVRKKNVMWVKTGDRWPRGVYLALKGEQLHGTNKAAN